MEKKKHIIGGFPLIVAFLFLFNPNLTIFDLLPDFIGYILLCAAISKLADLNDTVDGAYRIFKRMIFIDAGKILAIFWIFGMSDPRERNTSMLLWTFVFATVEVILLIPAFTKLFDGLVSMGYLLPNNSVFSKSGKTSRLTFTKILTVIFIIVKATMYTLPEFSVLTSSSYDETSIVGVIDLYDYIGIMRLLTFLPALIIGIIWLIVIILYFRMVLKDSLFTMGLEEKYRASVLPRKGLFVRRNFRTFTLVAIIAILLTYDFRLNFQNIMPDFLAAVLFAVTFVFLQKYTKSNKKHWIFSVIAFTYASVIASVAEYMFFDEYSYSAIERSDAARGMYTVVIVGNILKSLALMTVFCDMFKMLSSSVQLHTGFVSGSEHIGAGEAKMVMSVQKELKTELLWAFMSCVVYVISDICFDLFNPNFGYMGFINGVLALVCIAYFVRALNSLQQAIDTKYMLE